MKINASYYFPIELYNVLSLLRDIDPNETEIKVGIIVQITNKERKPVDNN